MGGEWGWEWNWGWGWGLAPPLAAQRDDVIQPLSTHLEPPGAKRKKLDSVGGSREVLTSRHSQPPLRADVTAGVLAHLDSDASLLDGQVCV